MPDIAKIQEYLKGYLVNPPKAEAFMDVFTFPTTKVPSKNIPALHCYVFEMEPECSTMYINGYLSFFKEDPAAVRRLEDFFVIYHSEAKGDIAMYDFFADIRDMSQQDPTKHESFAPLISRVEIGQILMNIGWKQDRSPCPTPTETYYLAPSKNPTRTYPDLKTFCEENNIQRHSFRKG